MNEEITNDEMYTEKINSAYINKTKLHIKLKNGNWFNGFVEEVGSDFFLFKDDINKPVEAVFFLELVKCVPYTVLNKEVKSDGGERPVNI